MAITEKSKAYHEKMFPGYVSSFLETDPEFIERFDNFTFDEVVNSDDLDDKTRWLAIKIISQCIPYIGYPRSLNALRCVNNTAETMNK